MSVTVLDTASASRPSILFAEDFDQPPPVEPVPEPEIIEPTFTIAEMEACRQEAWRAGEQSGAAAIESATTATARAALDTIASMLRDAADHASRLADDAAQTMTRLLFDGLALLFPTLCARFGQAETVAVLNLTLPALRQDPRPAIRIASALAGAVMAEIELLEPALAGKVTILPDDAMAPGDIRITWYNGSAGRDSRALWNEIAEILTSTGWPAIEIDQLERIDVQ